MPCLIIFLVNQSKLEFELCRVYCQNSGFGIAVQAVYIVSLEMQTFEDTR